MTGTGYRKRKQTTTMVLHNTHATYGDQDPMPVLEAGGRVVGLLDVGYHAVIGLDGTIHGARALDVVGSHTPGFNEESVGVALEGEGYTRAQYAALQHLYHIVRDRYGPIRVVGHTELGRHKRRANPCPAIDMDHLRFLLGAPTKRSTHSMTDKPSEPVGQRLSPQQTIVLDLLKAGRTLTNKLAATCYGVNDLPKRVSELRAMGYTIDREWDSEDFRGTEVKFRKYKIVEE